MTDANALAASSKTTLHVRPSNYGVTHLYWSFISTGWDSVTLVRNVEGYPTSITDGETLYTWTSAPAQSSTYLGISSKYHFFDTGAPNTSSTVNPGKGVVGTSLQGKTVYYALFMTYTVISNQYVTRSATASTPVIKDDGLFNNLLEFIPAVYKPDNTDLEDFLGLFAFHLSLYKQQATNIFDMHKVPTVDAKLLTALLNQFGASLYGDMSVSQGRTLLANLIEMYTQVGSTAGIKNFIELYTGYSSRISPGGVPGAEVPGGGVNMLLDYNSSSFVESLGSWVPNTSTGTGYSATAPYNSFASWIKTSEASVYPYGYSGSDAYQGIFASKGFLKMTAVLGATQDVILKLSPKITVAVTGTAATNTLICKPLIAEVGDYVINPSVKKGTYVTGITATTASLTLSNNLESTISAGTEVWFSSVAEDKQAALEANIPVVDVNQYTFSAFFNRGSRAGKSVKLAIMWYDSTGTFLSTSAYGTTLNTASGAVNTWQRATVTATSPTNAAYATPIVTFISCVNNDIMYMDGVQFQEGSSATTFQDARVVNITITPTRINEVLNPSFETNTTYWYTSNYIAPMVTGASGFALATRTTAAHIAGSYSGSVTLTTPSATSGTYTRTISTTVSTVTVSAGHGYTTGDTINVKITSTGASISGTIAVTSTTTFTLTVANSPLGTSVACTMYKPSSGSVNVQALNPSFNDLVPISSASYDESGNIVVNTSWPTYVTASQTMTGGSTVPDGTSGTGDISTGIISINSPTSFTTSSSGTNTSSLFDNNAYVFSNIFTNFFMCKNIYFNGSTSSATVSGITVDTNTQYVFSVSARTASSLATGIGVAALPYIITNRGNGVDYRIDNLPTIKGVSSDGAVATFYTNTPHQFLKADKVQIFGLPSGYYVDAAGTVPMSTFNTTGTTSIYTITEVGDRYFKATRSASMIKTSTGKTYFDTPSTAYAMWDLSTTWTRMVVPGNSIGKTLGTNSYNKAIVGLYVVQSFDTNNTGATFTVLVDNALLEKGAARNFYFDGHYDGHSLYDGGDRETTWAGTADASKSYYYKNWYTSQARLKDNLSDAILYGSGTIGIGPGWSALYNLTYSE